MSHFRFEYYETFDIPSSTLEVPTRVCISLLHETSDCLSAYLHMRRKNIDRTVVLTKLKRL